MNAAATGPFDLLVHASTDQVLTGHVQVPPDKSISHRVLMLAAIAEGRSCLRNVLASEDVHATLSALRAMGVNIQIVREQPRQGAFDLEVEGVGHRGLQSPSDPLDMGNSGTSMRLLAGLLCGQGVEAELVGDASLMRRPMHRIVKPLQEMGAQISCAPDGCPPVRIQATKALKGLHYQLPIASAQIKSAILLAGLGAESEVAVEEAAGGSSRNHTELLLRAQNQLRFSGSDQNIVCVKGGSVIKPLDLDVPADPSSAAFPMLAAALRPGSELVLSAVGVNATRMGFFNAMSRMGAQLNLKNRFTNDYGEPVADIVVRGSSLSGGTVEAGEIPSLIDEIPALAVAGYYSTGGFRLTGAGELRHKESDRLAAILTVMESLGDRRRQIQSLSAEEGFMFPEIRERFKLGGGIIDSRNDHRIAMAFAVAFPLENDLTIRRAECIETSFPDFAANMSALGLNMVQVDSV
ncbi:MAG: 3-phosphoshikimate 1-carboxyvinyltransferase [Gammaproteobacteria bacterium]